MTIKESTMTDFLFRGKLAELVIGVFFFLSLQMLFMGIIGEYIGTIHTLVQKRPLVDVHLLRV